jgi:3',5'-cyclic AMP phosphodiesterase CpdA
MRALLAVAALVATAGLAVAFSATADPSPAQSESAVVWAVGDAATTGERADRVAALVRRAKPDRFLYLGDVYERGTAADFRNHYGPVYGPLNRIAAPTPGNHEWGNRRTGYLPYWRRAKGRTQPSYYRFRVGGWEIVSLNSETAHRGGSRQQRWLKRALRRHSGSCRIAFMHRPYLSAGAYKPGTSSLGSVWRTLRGHARLVLSGHDHNMQRFKRRDGMNQYVSGAGGRERYGVNTRDRRLAFGRADRFGALRIVLGEGSAKLEFRSATGRVLDRSQVRCRPLG